MYMQKWPVVKEDKTKIELSIYALFVF